jgi:hypothetical protein
MYTQEQIKLCYQPEKEALLAALKEKLIDDTFTFSFALAPLSQRIKAVFSKKNLFADFFAGVIQSYKINKDDFLALTGLDEEIWQGILKGKYLPEKNLIYVVCLNFAVSDKDCEKMLAYIRKTCDYSCARDVVVKYLLQYKIYNKEMVTMALDEYKIDKSHLFIK